MELIVISSYHLYCHILIDTVLMVRGPFVIMYCGASCNLLLPHVHQPLLQLIDAIFRVIMGPLYSCISVTGRYRGDGEVSDITVSLGPIVISSYQLYSSLVSSLTVCPVILSIVHIFRKVDPRKKSCCKPAVQGNGR